MLTGFRNQTWCFLFKPPFVLPKETAKEEAEETKNLPSESLGLWKKKKEEDVLGIPNYPLTCTTITLTFFGISFFFIFNFYLFLCLVQLLYLYKTLNLPWKAELYNPATLTFPYTILLAVLDFFGGLKPCLNWKL